MSAAETHQPLEAVVADAETRLCFPGSKDHAIKVEVTREAGIQIELAISGARRWFQWTGEEFAELLPENDPKVPLAAWLADECFRRHVRVLAYRPGKRITLIDRSGHKPRILKGFRRGRLERMLEKYELAHSGLTGMGVITPEVVEYEIPTQSMVLTYQTGEPLTVSAESMDLFHVAGEALRAFQEHATPVGEKDFHAWDELAVVKTRASRLQRAGATLPAGFEDCLARIEAVGEHLPEGTLGLAHRDLHDGQFLQQPRSLVLLDFDLMTRADNALDAANFLAHLVLRQMQGVRGTTQHSVDQCGKKFLRGLDRAGDPGFWRRLRFYQATTFARLALVYLVRPRWSSVIADLLRMSHRCLDDFDRIREG